jgi:outer membrane protein assembly factor BamB
MHFATDFRFRFCTQFFLLLVLSFGVNNSVAHADDWPQWGGPQRDLVWRETGIVKTLPTTGLLPRVWSVPIGEGYSGPAVADGRVYITDYMRKKNRRNNTERVLCLDAESGRRLWKHEYKAVYTVKYPNGPRSTPVVDGDRVYTIGAIGDLFCFNAETGKILWKKNFVKDFGARLAIWGTVASPLVDGNQLITLVGGKRNSLVVSFDKMTGKELWRSLDSPAVGYAPPLIFTFGNTRQLIIWHPLAISSLNPANGKVIWEVPFQVNNSLTIATPRKVGNRLFVSSFYNGPMMINVSRDGRSAKVAWRGTSTNEQKTDGLHCLIPTPWMTKNHIYGVCSYGELRCLDAKTGERVWSTYDATGHARWWTAFIVPHEDRYFIHNEQGDLIIANLSPDGYKEISRAKLVEPTRDVLRRKTIWSHPAFAMKSVFARNDKEIVRVSLAAEE